MFQKLANWKMGNSEFNFILEQFIAKKEKIFVNYCKNLDFIKYSIID
jgi:hypothetical protein